MREKIISKTINHIKSKKKISDIQEDTIRYGLESIYILVTKLIFIFALALILGIFKEMIIFLLLFNVIRTFAFGLHATKSYICLISSSIIFIGLPILCNIINIPNIIKLIIGLVSIGLIIKNCPADTYKRPIINKKRRRILKLISTIISVIYVILFFYTNKFISNCLLFSLLLEVILTSPLTYKLFKLPYNNYLKYLEGDDNNVFC